MMSLPRLGVKLSTWLACLILGLTHAFALTVDIPLPDPAQEARAKALFHEIRCVVCQSEAIADSPAEVARDMRILIRSRIAAGDSDDTIRQYLVTRYGDFILMKPPFMPATWLLWLGPAIVLALGCMLAWHIFRRPRREGKA